MPKISSKFKRSERTVDIGKFKARDGEGLIKKGLEGAPYYGGNEIYFYP